jgi:hypothetical protein
MSLRVTLHYTGCLVFNADGTGDDYLEKLQDQILYSTKNLQEIFTLNWRMNQGLAKMT